MQTGRPIFSQEREEAPPAEAKVEVKEKRKSPADRLARKLSLSSNWSKQPYMAHQARVYPDTVKVVSEKWMVFRAEDTADMDRYSEIMMSHHAGAEYKVTSEEQTHWDASKSSFVVIMRVQERLFKSLKTTYSDPDEP